MSAAHADTSGTSQLAIRPYPQQYEERIEFLGREVLHQGLGALLMNKIVRYCRAREMSEIFGDVLATNPAMLALMHKIGFHRVASEDPGVVRVSFALPGGDAAPR